MTSLFLYHKETTCIVAIKLNWNGSQSSIWATYRLGCNQILKHNIQVKYEVGDLDQILHERLSHNMRF